MNHPLHLLAVGLAREFRKVELHLVEVLQKIDEEKLFRTLGFSSLFDYTTRALGLSESVSYGLITVSRKAKAVPELKMALNDGTITVSIAKRVTSVINSENAAQWIEKARTLTQRELEKEVAKVNPETQVRERARYVTGERLELKLGISDSCMKKFKRVQDLESQKTREHCGLERALEAMIDLYLERKDPVKMAARNDQTTPSSRKEKPVRVGRQTLSASERHRVNIRDQGQCAHIYSDGNRCENRRWVEIHHKKPVSQGGGNHSENLITLCSSHHKHVHDTSEVA